MWNPHCWQNANASPFKKLIESYELIVIHDTDFPTHLSSTKISIIDLTIKTLDLDLFLVWEIFKKYLLLSHPEFILIK